MTDYTDLVRDLGEPILSDADALHCLSEGDYVFAFHDMDDEPIRVTDPDVLKGYTHDQLMVVPHDAVAQRLERLKDNVKQLTDSLQLAGGSGLPLSEADHKDLRDATQDLADFTSKNAQLLGIAPRSTAAPATADAPSPTAAAPAPAH
ncbi:hypothetical protein [Dyella ginsengisoli]|uniref:hypothetical protein n=1 Tax=Dyella ginsengisoli TaxID=363848 RepID=UPI00034A6E87|nr:hypothetical protein [Dyella ginsengisoli]